MKDNVATIEIPDPQHVRFKLTSQFLSRPISRSTKSIWRICADAIPGANLKGLKLVLDCANGAASQLGPALFRSLSTEVTAPIRNFLCFVFFFFFFFLCGTVRIAWAVVSDPTWAEE